MRNWKSSARYLVTASLMVAVVVALFLFTAAVAAAPAPGVTVEVSIAPCLRVRADETLQSNIPTVSQQDAGYLLTVTAR